MEKMGVLSSCHQTGNKGGVNVHNAIKSLISEKYKSEAACARQLGWERQRLNKITTGFREPSVYEVNELARVLERPVGDLVLIFLRMKSPNG